MPYRLISLFLTLIFLLFALLQYNDPEPFFWGGVYLMVAFFHLSAAYNKPRLLPSIIGTVVSLLGAISLWPSEYLGIVDDMNTGTPQIELARESLGLAVASFSLCFLSLKAYKDQRVATSQLNGKEQNSQALATPEYDHQ